MNYAATAILYAALWYSAVVAAVIIFFSDQSLDEELSTTPIRALGSLGFGAVVAPLIENFIFTSALKLYADSNPKMTAFIAAAIAAALHAPRRSFFSFGLFYIIAAVYLTHFKKNPKYAFFLGFYIHSVCNFPASVIPLLYATGLLAK
ncbi:MULTISPECIES: hypothetical protein [unclassified Undibacterium]|uniref:hypothetical protein n=1 Tax=unclassified Undibacterium TaxID=2630295 RepID=UPI002AC99DBA|nr:MULTISPECIES: hypothetical protein [unclassified Undibacterium]WPX41829.1 hypothetical protein RHM61_10405 [Undibacterium sp. CCC3.4]